MSEQKFKGRILMIGEVQSGIASTTGKQWKKVSFMVEEQGKQFPQKVAFTVFGEEKVNSFLQYRKPGDEVEVSYNFEAREYNGKFYTDVMAWKTWATLDGPAGTQSVNSTNAVPVEPEEEDFDLDEEDDDLPF